MDSKLVSKEIKSKVWPELKKLGFETFTSRVAWRHHSERIDVVEFRSFNSYNASIMGVTTFSFGVHLGMFPMYIPPRWPPKEKGGKLLPSEAECPFRGALNCSIEGRLKDATIWSVDPAGRNLGWCIQDVVNQLPVVSNWFSELSTKEKVLGVLTEKEQSMPELWGFGNNPSPHRSYLTGYVARAVGNRPLAEKKLAEAVGSNCYAKLFNSVEEALRRAL